MPYERHTTPAGDRDTATGDTRDPRDAEVAVLPWVDQAVHARSRGREPPPAQAFRSAVGLRLEHERRYCAYQHRLRDTQGPMVTNVAGHLAALGGMANQYHISQIERIEECRQIIGIGVQVVSVSGLIGSATAATIMGDRAIAMRSDQKQLIVPHINCERPSVAKDHRLTYAPVLVKDLCDILCSDCSSHTMKFSFFLLVLQKKLEPQSLYEAPLKRPFGVNQGVTSTKPWTLSTVSRLRKAILLPINLSDSLGALSLPSRSLGVKQRACICLLSPLSCY